MPSKKKIKSRKSQKEKKPDYSMEIDAFNYRQRNLMIVSVLAYLAFQSVLSGAIGIVIHMLLWQMNRPPSEEEVRTTRPHRPFASMAIDTGDVAAYADWKDPGPRPAEITKMVKDNDKKWGAILAIYLVIFVIRYFVIPAL